MHGLLGILPIQVGITRDSLLTKDTLLAPSSLQSLHPLEPAICIEALTRPAFSSYPPSRLKLTQYRAVRDLLTVAHGSPVAADSVSLKSPRVKRISSPRKFRSPPSKDFVNSIGPKRPPGSISVVSAFGSLSAATTYYCRGRN